MKTLQKIDLLKQITDPAKVGFDEIDNAVANADNTIDVYNWLCEMQSAVMVALNKLADVTVDEDFDLE